MNASKAEKEASEIKIILIHKNAHVQEFLNLLFSSFLITA